MKCPACVTLGLKSTLLMDGYSTSTLMAWSSYYDEEGIYHGHDPNRHSTGARCSNDHSISWSSYSECPAGDYDKEEIVRVNYRCDVCKNYGKDTPDSETCTWCEYSRRAKLRDAKRAIETAYKELPGWIRRRKTMNEFKQEVRNAVE